MKIIIAGDSWGIGEWTDGQRTHRGLEQYLLDDGHSVINLSRGGMSNMSIIDALEQGLKEHKDADRVIWFQTDPMRELLTSEEEIPLGTIMPGIEGFNLYRAHLVLPLEAGVTQLTQGESIHNSKQYYRVTVNHTVGSVLDANYLVSVPYRRFSDTGAGVNTARTESLNLRENIKIGLRDDNMSMLSDATKIISRNLEFLNQAYERANNLGHNIYCIGGLSKLKLDLISNYPNLIPAIPSVLEMIYPQYQHADIVSANSNWRQELMTKVTLDRKSVDYFFEQYTLEHVMISLCREYFYPDGTHPNRRGHLKIYEKLKKSIECLGK